MNRFFILIVVMCYSITILAQQPFKGVWLTNVGTNALYTASGIDSAVALCKQKNITDIFMVVWNRGYTLYPSKCMKKKFGVAIDPRFAQRDPLQELITAAHAKQIKVHAWFEFGFSSDYKDSNAIIPITKPSWMAMNKEGKHVIKNGFRWMNAFKPQVQQFMLSLIKEVVHNYNIDGIQGDDRLPANPTAAGYDAYTIALYKKQHKGIAPPRNELDTAWVQWRANILNDFAQKIYTQVKRIKSNVLVSMAPSIYPWSKQEYLQDWPTWLRNNYVDIVIPQVYRYNIDAYTKTLETQLAMFTDIEKKKIYIGMLTSLGDGYLVEANLFKAMQQVNQKNNIAGECYFYFGNIDKYLQ